MRKLFVLLAAIVAVSIPAALVGGVGSAQATGSCINEFNATPTATSGSFGFAESTAMSCSPAHWDFQFTLEYKDGGVWHSLHDGFGIPVQAYMPEASCTPGPGSDYTGSTQFHLTVNQTVSCGAGEGKGYYRDGTVDFWKYDDSAPITNIANFDLRIHFVAENIVDGTNIDTWNSGVRAHN